ncbi:MAG: hypothetical protein ACRDVE_09470 [Actinocrinis sp.]
MTMSLVEEAAAQAAVRRRWRASRRHAADAGKAGRGVSADRRQPTARLTADASERDQWSDDALWPGTVANPRRTQVR